MQSNSDSIKKKLEALKSTSPPKITITETTILSPILKSVQPSQLQQQQKQHNQLYTTLTAKQITTNPTAAAGTGSWTNPLLSSAGTGTTQISKVAIKDLKEFIQIPLPKSSTTATTTSSVLSGGVSTYNMAIVAAKRPQLTIVATKSPVVGNSTLPPSAVSSSTKTIVKTPTTTSTTMKSSTTATADTSTESSKMEHSYIRETPPKPIEITNGLQPARTILVRKPPQCPSCHTHPLDEQDLNDANQAPIPSYNEISAKEAMMECARIAKYVKNTNSDDEDWETKINQIGWSNMQKNLFSKVVRILDNDQLGRLANLGRPNEAMQRRVVVDKSAGRMRKALASVAWDPRLTQWLHCFLIDCLPASYMASYLDILQTLKSKLPTLVDKMLFGRPVNVCQELLAPVLKKKWEPQIATKNRILPQNAVIVALPSMPTSGPVPNRLQKWYQHLATIAQIVQVTLPMTSGHISRQPLDQVAEQIVSLTRVKIQELRNEKSQRSIILIGFNAGAALALQVAMSENVSCVVCMGFAYNTYNGVRGTPDDKILDIKVPILFVVGQNSARSSPEEIEGLREKMQSESSLVVVGSADDVLRVPKSRRKIESVTQAMVDTMVVDEVYDFIKRVLTNPPGPRTPTVINSAIYGKQSKVAGERVSGQARKRKQEGGDSDSTPAKTKHLKEYKKKEKQETKPLKKSPKVQDPFQIKRKVGRPRTRPLPNSGTATASSKASQMHTSTPVMVGKTQSKIKSSTLTNDDLNQAIQSIMNDTNDADSSLNTSNDSQKMITNFELVAQSGKSVPIKSTNINVPQKQVIIGSSPSTMGTKIKMIPSNQFVQLKPTALQSQSKIYTIKTGPIVGGQPKSDAIQGPRIGSIVTTSPNTSSSGQHIFTLKTPTGQTTQFATAVGGQQKFTVIKNTAGNTTLQLSAKAKTLHPIASTSSGSSSSNYDISNIIDMPILFADNDGNISDTVSSPQPAVENKQQSTVKPASSGVGQLIISQKIIKEANSPATTTTVKPTPSAGGSYLLNKTPGRIMQPQLGGMNKAPNKFVFINRNTMKPCSNILTRNNLTQSMTKYTKVVVTNTKSPAGASIVPRASGSHITGLSSGPSPIASTVKQINIQSLSSASSSTNSTTTTPARTGGILNVQTKNLPQIQIINNPHATLVSTDKPQIRNIVVKPGGLKQLPPHLTSQLLNRNLTVRKLVNLVPATKAVAPVVAGGSMTLTSSPNPSSASTTPDATDPVLSSPSSVNATTIQTSPKIITLNPLSRTSTPSTKSD